jgi:hypothetical protein
MSNTSFIGLPERLSLTPEQWRQILSQFACDMRVALPGIVQSFNPVAQTVVVQLALRERVNQNYIPANLAIQPLQDVPIVLPRGGGYAITVPIVEGDEVLVIFGDMCIDSWWQSGEVQDQLVKRRHDLSDGFAILAPWSQPRTLPEYSQSSIQIRTTDDPSTYMEIINGQISSNANLNCPSAASATFTDQTGRIFTVINGVVSNAEGSLSGLINSTFFTQATNAINSCNALADLQRIVNDMFNGFHAVTSDITLQVASLATLAAGVSTLAEVVTWITNFQAFVLGPITNLTSQLASLTTQFTALVTAATNRATALGGSIVIPPI